MANDINNAKSGATDNTGSIKLGTVVVQAPIKTFTANNFKGDGVVPLVSLGILIP